MAGCKHSLWITSLIDIKHTFHTHGGIVATSIPCLSLCPRAYVLPFVGRTQRSIGKFKEKEAMLTVDE